MATESATVRVALDVMGGDHAPKAIMKGALQAARDLPGLHLILVGREDVIKAELAAAGDTAGLPLSIVHASEVIEMEEHTMAVKDKRDSSMVVAVRLVKEGKADAFVTAGNSGAGMAAGLFGLGRIHGIERPAFCTVYPASVTPLVLLDMGANTDPKPEHLLQNGIMGSIYAEHVLGIARPRVGLVSNGEEADKGSMVVRDAYKLLSSSGLNFVGNLEGKDVPKGMADVAVTDGFTGNVMIKLSEGIFSFLVRTLKTELTRGWRNKLALILMLPGAILLIPGLLVQLPTYLALKKRIDWRETGAAPVLGINGVVLIAHGRSDAKAIRNSIRAAIKAVRSGYLAAITEHTANASPAQA